MNKSNSHNTSQLIHAGIELVVGACVTFWLNRKISSVSQKVCLLEDKLKFYESMLSQHHELIKKLYSIIEGTPPAVKMDKPTPTPVSKISSKMEDVKTKLPPVAETEPVPGFTALPNPTPAPKESFSEVEPMDFIDKGSTETEALDAILSVEIEDIKINQNPSLR